MAQRENWESEFRDLADQAGREVQTAIAYVNDRVIPELRKQAAQGLAAAASGIHQLADLLEHGVQSGRAPGSASARGAWARR